MAQLVRLQTVCRSVLNRSNVLPIVSQSVNSKRDFFGKLRRVDGKDVSPSEIRLAEPVEHATGLERLLLLAEEKGIDDPFCMKPRKRGPGTKGMPHWIHLPIIVG